MAETESSCPAAAALGHPLQSCQAWPVLIPDLCDPGTPRFLSIATPSFLVLLLKHVSVSFCCLQLKNLDVVPIVILII